MRNIDGRPERPIWDDPQHQYQEKEKVKTYGKDHL